MSKSQELKPCVFCSSVNLKVFDQPCIAWIQCSDCEADGPPKDTATEAIEAWNRRPASSEQQAAQQDAERYKWLLEQAWFQAAFDRFEPQDRGMQKKFVEECARIIDAARASNGGK